jgi:hypothetical protein
LKKLAVYSQKTAQSGCTGLSGGAPDSVRCARLATVNWLLSRFRRRHTAINHRTVRSCTGLSGEPTVGLAKCRLRNPRATRGRANSQKGAPDCPVCTGLSGVHRTVSGAPTALKLQRSASPEKERNPQRTVSGGAPDCPVRQATEGKKCLPAMLSTAPSCHGVIKGTPRRMEEDTKASFEHC